MSERKIPLIRVGEWECDSDSYNGFRLWTNTQTGEARWFRGSPDTSRTPTPEKP